MSRPEENSKTCPDPLVSVSMTTYNLAESLPRALDSVLQQKTDFPIEIVIGDDCSQDASLSVARSYQKRYPEVIRVLERSRNVGVQRNTYETLEQCRGKYIAFLDADDFWTDPEKLAIQTEILESDPTVSVCCHAVRWVDLHGEVTRERYPSISGGRHGVEDIIRRNFVPTLSAVFRNGIHRQLPEWYFDFRSLSDWPIWVLSSLSGDIVLLDRVMADYSVSPGGSFTSKGELFWYQSDAEFYERLESLIPSNWLRIARAEKGSRYESLSYCLRKRGEFAAARKAAFKAFCAPFLMDRVSDKTKSLLASLVRELEWRVSWRGTAVGR